MKISTLIKLLLTLIALVSLNVAAHAQNVSATIKIYKFEYRSSFAPNISVKKKVSGQTYWYKNGATWSSFSDADGDKITINYNGPSRMIIYRKVGRDNSDKSFSAMSEIVIPSNSRDVFVLMIKTNSMASFYAMNVSPNTLPKGKVAVMNMTNRVLAIMFGEDKKALRPNGNAIFSDKKKQGASPVLIATKVQGKWEISYKSRVHYPQDERCIMLIYDTSNQEIPNLNVNIVQF